MEAVKAWVSGPEIRVNHSGLGRCGRTPRDQIASICWIIEKARKFQKNTYFCFIDYTKTFDCLDHIKLWKVLQETGISDHLTCIPRNLYAGQEAAVRTEHGTTDWFQMGKEVCQGCILPSCLFNLNVEYIMRHAGLDEAQAGIKIARRNINKLRYADDTTLMAENKEVKSLLMSESKRGEWKSWLKAQHSKNKDHVIQSHHFMANRWGNSGNTDRFYFWGSKMTADGDCNREIKRCLLLRRRVTTNLDSILKSRDITLLTSFV